MKSLVALLALLAALLAAPLAAQNPCAGFSLGTYGNLNGFHIFPGSPHATPVTTLPVDPINAQWQTEMGSIALHPDNSIPFTVVDSSLTPPQPVTMQSYGFPDSDLPRYALSPLVASAGIESGAPQCPYNANGPGNGADPLNPDGTTDHGDHHVVAVDRNTCFVNELWRGSFCGGQWRAANGAVWNLNGNQQRPLTLTSVDASGLSVFAGLGKYEEASTPICSQMLGGVSVQTLCTALRFTTQHIHNGTDSTGRYAVFYVPPASHAPGGQCCNGDANYMGQRIRMKASTNVSGYSGDALVLLHTMMTLGMINQDIGGDLYVQISADPRWSDAVVNGLKNFHGSDFEVVQMNAPLTDNTAPTGPAPTNVAPTVTPSLLIEGQSVALSWPASVGASYEYVTDGLPSVTGSETLTPNASTCYALTSRNLYGTATSACAPVTVLPILFRGAGGTVGAR